MIRLAAAPDNCGYRYHLSGHISKNSQWAQTLEIPADGSSVSISGSVVRIAFRKPCVSHTDLEIFSPSEITITDADTLTISVGPTLLGQLCSNTSYVVDLTSVTSSIITHWGHGMVFISDNPPSY